MDARCRSRGALDRRQADLERGPRFQRLRAGGVSHAGRGQSPRRHLDHQRPRVARRHRDGLREVFGRAGAQRHVDLLRQGGGPCRRSAGGDPADRGDGSGRCDALRSRRQRGPPHLRSEAESRHPREDLCFRRGALVFRGHGDLGAAGRHLRRHDQRQRRPRRRSGGGREPFGRRSQEPRGGTRGVPRGVPRGEADESPLPDSRRGSRPFPCRRRPHRSDVRRAGGAPFARRFGHGGRHPAHARRQDRQHEPRCRLDQGQHGRRRRDGGQPHDPPVGDADDLHPRDRWLDDGADRRHARSRGDAAEGVARDRLRHRDVCRARQRRSPLR